MLPFICFVFYIVHFQNVISQICSNGLINPPTITWTPSPTSPTIFTTILTFDVSTKTWNNGAISLTTRLFNDLLGGPTMRMERGNQYEVTLVNNLGPERSENAKLTPFEERDPNTTNLHTHGLHISPLDPGDAVLPPILPGENQTYIYHIPCSHSGGTHWYHSHYHTSVQLHVGGGAAGAIIINDDPIKEHLPDWYINMRELIFFINHIDATFFTTGYPTRTRAQTDNQKILSLSPNNKDLYIVNGKYQPTVCQSVNEWIKFRFLHTEIKLPAKYQIGEHNNCTLKLLSRDGIIVQAPPRDVGNIVWLSEGSRADVAITCVEGIHSIIALNNGDIIAFIHVVQNNINNTNDLLALTSFEPQRPIYLTDLSNAVIDNSLTLETRHNSIVINNGQPFQKTFFPNISNIQINSVNEWRLKTQTLNTGFQLWHPVHLHAHNFQIISAATQSGSGGGHSPVSWQQDAMPPDGYNQPGDFVDTVWGPSVIRFITDIFGGPLIVHCHQLEHEVIGALGIILIENGCDALYNDYNMIDTCSFDDSCHTVTPTIIPSNNPTIIPTNIPTNIPTTIIPTNIPTTLNPTKIPTMSPSNNPTIIPTLNPTSYPTTSNPSKIPTIHPPDNELQYRQLKCGDEISGSYSNEILYFKIGLFSKRDVTFDASKSNFNIFTLSVFELQKNGFDVSIHGNILRLNNLEIGDYIFSIEGGGVAGTFNIVISCSSINLLTHDVVTSTTRTTYDENDSFVVIPHMVGLFSIIGVLLLCFLLVIICNCVICMYFGRKYQNIANGANGPYGMQQKRFSLKSLDTQIDSSPTTDSVVVSVVDDSPFVETQISIPPYMSLAQNDKMTKSSLCEEEEEEKEDHILNQELSL